MSMFPYTPNGRVVLPKRAARVKPKPGRVNLDKPGAFNCPGVPMGLQGADFCL